jgi:hypothetical protein
MVEAKPVLKIIFSLVIFFVASVTSQSANAAGAVSTPPLNIQFDNSGLSTLKFGDADLLKAGTPQLIDLHFTSNAVIKNCFDKTAEHFDAVTHTLTQSYNWGSTTIAYHPQADRLVIDLTVSNTAKIAITQARFDLLHVQFPTVPTGYDWEHRYGYSYNTPDDLPVLLADWGAAKLALCSEDLSKPVGFSFSPLDGDPYAVRVWLDGAPIKPGTSRSATLSLRFGDSGLPGWMIAKDVLAKFAAKYPAELNWKDRRPIGSAFLATSMKGYKTNPRGWFLDPDLDTGTPQGREVFHTKLMTYADDVIAHCKLMDAQGVIVWDLEGQEMPHATSYLADPRMLSRVAPEMDATANEFFKRFKDAGLRIGITIRPTRVEPLPDGKPGWTQVEVPNPVDEMDSKITYAQRRWGCTLFYCDSNVNFVRDAHGKILNDPAMPASDFQTLARRHQGCLLIPEHKTARYYAYTAPYSELRLGIASTPSEIRETYPHAFSVLRVVDGPPLDSESVTNQLVSTINSGDILLFRPWWDDPTTAQIKRIYTLATTRRSEAK